MKKIFFILIWIILSYSKTLIATYEAKYGFFGTIASAKGIFEYNNTNYKIKTFTKTEGFAKTIANIKQSYISEGNITNGILIPHIYKVIIIRKGVKYTNIYRFDYKNRKIIKTAYKEKKLRYKKLLPFFANNDILSLYFNIPKIMTKNFQSFKAVGGDRKTGQIDVEVISKNKKITKIKANLHNKVFAEDKGILFLDINTTNWVTLRGKVINVLKIGDLKGELKSFKLIP